MSDVARKITGLVQIKLVFFQKCFHVTTEKSANNYFRFFIWFNLVYTSISAVSDVVPLIFDYRNNNLQ